MSFGGQTIGLVTVTKTGGPGFMGVEAENRATTLVSGVHFRPLNTIETPVAATDVATEIWKCTAPPEAGVLAAQSTGTVLFDGTNSPADVEANRFQIEGPIMPKYDGSQVHHVTIMCKRQHG